MQKIHQMLMESIFEVFEKMYYLFLEPLDVERVAYDMTASIGFHGPAEGEIRVMVSKQVAEKMTQNMMNLKEEELNAKCVEDCLKEAVNMICGNFLCKFDSSRVFHLGMPAFEGTPVAVDYTELLPSVRLAFEAEGDGVGLNMSMKDQTS